MQFFGQARKKIDKHKIKIVPPPIPVPLTIPDMKPIKISIIFSPLNNNLLNKLLLFIQSFYMMHILKI